MSAGKPTTDMFSHQKVRRTRREQRAEPAPAPYAGPPPTVDDPRGAVAGQRLRRTIADRSFEIHFQPIVDLESGHHQGAEALARFPGDPAQTPDRWFAEAASVGLRTDLELAAFELAIAELDRLPDEMYLSVNVSVGSLLTDRFRDTLAGVPADRLVLELSLPPGPVDDTPLAAAIADLRSGGVRVAVGDDTVGEEAIRRLLRRMPDIVKLDLTPSRGMDARQVLGRALLRFGYELYSTTMVAQGIEDRGTIAVLRSLSCTVGQGFALARPSRLIAPPALLLPPPLVLPGPTAGPVLPEPGPLSDAGTVPADVDGSTRGRARDAQLQDMLLSVT